MRTIALALTLLVACGSPGTGDGPDAGGPDAGVIDPVFVGTFAADWHDGPTCFPPGPFGVKPDLVTIDAVGTIEWIDSFGTTTATHHGQMHEQDPVLVVPEAVEFEFLRQSYFIWSNGGAYGTVMRWTVNERTRECFVALSR